MMRIREMAEKLRISARAIRFYEEKGLIAPAKADGSRYRMFSGEDARRLQMIVSLREVGVPLEEIGRVLERLDAGQGDEIAGYLEEQRSLLFSRWLELKQLIATVDEMIGRISGGGPTTPGPPELFRLAESSKKLRETRGSWNDRWDFDKMASAYDDLIRENGSPSDFRPCYEETLAAVEEWISPAPGENGLDIGSGTGNLAGRLAGAGARMSGIDQSAAMLNLCGQKFPAVETKLGNALAVPYFDGHFDFVVSTYAVGLWTGDQRRLAIGEMARVLKPHGRLCLADAMRPEADEAETGTDAGAESESRAVKAKAAVGSACEESMPELRLAAMLAELRNLGFAAVSRRVGGPVYVVFAVRTR